MLVENLSRPQIGLLLLLFSSIVITALGLLFVFQRSSEASKIFSTASAVMGIASIVQLKISGWFDAVVVRYGDVDKFPYGPPDEITRQIIDNPDFPVQTFIRNTIFFDPNTGPTLGIISLLLAICAAWT